MLDNKTPQFGEDIQSKSTSNDTETSGRSIAFSDNLSTLQIENSIGSDFIKLRTKLRKQSKCLMFTGYILISYNFISGMINILRIINLFFSDRDDVIQNSKDENPEHVFYKW